MQGRRGCVLCACVHEHVHERYMRMRGDWLFFFVQHKNTHNKERFAPATRQGTSGGGFRRNNPEAVCVAALLIAPREKAGGGIEGGLYLWFVWLENGCDRGRAAKAKVTEGHVAARDERRWSASRRSVHSSKPALSTTRSIVAPPPDRSSSSSATTAGVSSASSCAFERTWLKASADDATPASAGQRLRSMGCPRGRSRGTAPTRRRPL
jgi:hypothetical protein